MAKKKAVQQRKKHEAVMSQQAIVPIKWNIPETMHSVYASNTLIQVMEHEIKLTFFEMKPPIRINTNDPLVTEVQADCVASVILHPKKVLSLIEGLQRQLKLFVDREQGSSTNSIEPEQPS